MTNKNLFMLFPAHWAPNGLLFYTGDQFPEKYKNGAFIAFHGSWNRAPGRHRQVTMWFFFHLKMECQAAIMKYLRMDLLVKLKTPVMQLIVLAV